MQMKQRIFILLGLIVIISSCKFDEKGYSFIREYDGGTYLTSQGSAKYISGSPDTATVIRDIYAKVEETVNHIYYNEGVIKDSILIYGHVWGTIQNPKITDSTATFFSLGEELEENAEITDFSDATLSESGKFLSVMTNLETETRYYVRSFVITGKLGMGKLGYKDTAYNPIVLEVITAAPNDVWERQEDYPGNNGTGHVSFAYKDQIYVGLEHNEAANFGDIYRYDPKAGLWDANAVATYGGGMTKSPPSNAIAFVLLNVEILPSTYRDYVYIGTGFIDNGDGTTSVSDEFYRLDLTALTEHGEEDWVKLSWRSQFSHVASARDEAVAFSLNGNGYIGFGTAQNGAVFDNWFKFEPLEHDSDLDHSLYPQGEWSRLNTFPYGRRTNVTTFTIGSDAYLCCGKDEEGTFSNKLFRARESTTGQDLAWTSKAEFPGTPRIDAAGFTIDEFGYVGTGFDGDSTRTDFYQYNPFTNSWVQKTNFGSVPRRNAIGEGIKFGENDYRGYMGFGLEDEDIDFLNDLWEYRP